jgi:hypothetical protein
MGFTASECQRGNFLLKPLRKGGHVRISPDPTRHGQIPKWPNGADCKSAVSDFAGSNPALPTPLESSVYRGSRAISADAPTCTTQAHSNGRMPKKPHSIGTTARHFHWSGRITANRSSAAAWQSRIEPLDPRSISTRNGRDQCSFDALRLLCSQSGMRVDTTSFQRCCLRF